MHFDLDDFALRATTLHSKPGFDGEKKGAKEKRLKPSL